MPNEAKHSPNPGAYKSEFTLPESFFDELPEDELSAFEGTYSTDPISVAERTEKRRKLRSKRA